MGYTKKRKTFNIEFTDESEYFGLQVRARSLSVNEFVALVEQMPEGAAEGKVSAKDLKEIQGMYSSFIDSAISWNMEEEDGTPTPLTLDSLMDLDFDLANDLIVLWMDGVMATSSVPVPLGEGSNAGAISPVLSLPMEPLSSSRAS